MATLGELSIKVGAHIEGFEKSMGTVSQRLNAIDRDVTKAFSGFDKIGSRLTGLGSTLSVGFTVPLAGAAVAATKFATDLNASMANIATLIPNSTARVAELKQSVQDLAIQTGKSTGDIAGGLYQVISAFGDSADTVKILDTNARAAAAGLATTLDAINLTSAVTKGYGDTSAEAVQKASDLAFVTVKLGQTTFPELASSIGRVVPLAAALGVSQEELFAVMATGTGVTGSAAEVSTQFRGALQSLLSPTQEMAKLLESLGVESGKALIGQLGLKGALDTVSSAAAATGQPLQKYVSQIEAQTLLLALAGPQADTFSTKLQAMGRAAGATDEAFREQTQVINEAGFTMQQVASRAQVMAEKFGDVLAPALNQALTGLEPLLRTVESAVTGFGKLPQPVQNTALALAGVAAAAGPLAIVAGQATIAISGMAKAAIFLTETGILAWSAEFSRAITGNMIGPLTQGQARLLEFGKLLRGIAVPVVVGVVVHQALSALLETKTATDNLNKALEKKRENLDILNEKWRENEVALGRLFPKVDAGKDSILDFVKGLKNKADTLGKNNVALTDSQKAFNEFRKAIEEEKKKLQEASAQAKIHEQAMRELGLETDKTKTKTREFLDLQPVLAAKFRIVESEYKKNIESLAALKVALERGTVGTLDLASASERLGADLGHLGTSIKDLPDMPGYDGTIRELDELGGAYSRLRIKTVGELKAIADQHLADFNKIERSGTATAKVLSDAWGTWAEAAVEAARQAGEDIPIEIEGMLAASKRKMDTGTRDLKKPWQTFGGEVSTIITNLTQDLSKMLFDGNLSFAEKFKGSLKSLGEAVTSSFIQPATAAITGFITGTLQDLIGGKGFGGVLGRIGELGSGIAGIFSGIGGGLSAGAGGAAAAGSQAVNSIVGGAGGAASSAASVAKAASGALGMVNVASSVLSSVTDVLSFLGQRHIEKDVAGIEVTTRAIFAEIFNLRVDSWQRETHLMGKLDDLWTTLREGFGADYERQGDILNGILNKGDDLINAVRSIGSVVSLPITTVGESIETQLSRMRSDLVGAQAARGGLEALHKSFESINSLYGRFLNEGPELFAEALRITGAAEADALAVGVSDSLKQNFSTLYGLIASGQGLEDHAIFRALSLVTGGIQAEMEKLGDYEQLGGQVRSLESTIERLEKERVQRERNTIGFLVDVNERGFAAVVDSLKSIGATLADGFSGFVKQIAPPGASAPATPVGPLLGSGADPLAAAARTRIGQLDTEMADILARVDFVRNLAKGDYNPTAELAELWTMVTRDAAGEWAARVEERAALEALAFRNTPINQRPIQVELVVDGIRLGNALVSATELAGGGI